MLIDRYLASTQLFQMMTFDYEKPTSINIFFSICLHKHNTEIVLDLIFVLSDNEHITERSIQMKINFNVVEMPVQDMIADELPIEDIVAVTQFQTAIKCGASIETLDLVDIVQEVEENNQILTMLYMTAVVNNESYKIIIHVSSNDMLKHLLTYGSSSSIVMNYIRQLLQ